MSTIAESFDEHWVEDPSTGCWIWQRWCDKDGYGRFNNCDRKKVYAHRFAYEREHGPIPNKLQVRHTCHNPPCVNPAHLLVGTNLQNYQDSVRAGRRINKTTDDDIRAIRRRCTAGETQAAVRVDYDLSKAAISFIVNYKRWGHVK